MTAGRNLRPSSPVLVVTFWQPCSSSCSTCMRELAKVCTSMRRDANFDAACAVGYECLRCDEREALITGGIFALPSSNKWPGRIAVILLLLVKGCTRSCHQAMSMLVSRGIYLPTYPGPKHSMSSSRATPTTKTNMKAHTHPRGPHFPQNPQTPPVLH